jgi:hypothetical protein
MNRTEHVTIERPVQEVWDYLMDTRNDAVPLTRSAVDVTGPVAGRGSYRLEPVGSGTRVTMTMETDAHRFFELAEPIFARMARRDIATSCEHLKDILEANGTRRNDSRTDGP